MASQRQYFRLLTMLSLLDGGVVIAVCNRQIWQRICAFLNTWWRIPSGEPIDWPRAGLILGVVWCVTGMSLMPTLSWAGVGGAAPSASAKQEQSKAGKTISGAAKAGNKPSKTSGQPDPAAGLFQFDPSSWKKIAPQPGQKNGASLATGEEAEREDDSTQDQHKAVPENTPARTRIRPSAVPRMSVAPPVPRPKQPVEPSSPRQDFLLSSRSRPPSVVSPQAPASCATEAVPAPSPAAPPQQEEAKVSPSQKQLQAMEADRQTLQALKDAVMELGLQKELDFLTGDAAKDPSPR